MSLHPITLETDKSITSIISEPEVLGQSEKGQVLEVSVLNSSQEPYDLSAENLSITFGENKAEGRMILDKGTANDADSGHFEITDAKNGKFNYTLCSACYEASGNAWFEIYIGDKFVDSTERFRIEVQESQRINMQNNNYVSDMAAMEDHFNASLDKYADSLKDLTTVTDNAKNQAQAEIDQIKTQITNYSKQFADITSEWTTQKQKIQDEADAQVASLKNADKDALDSAIQNINTQRDAALDQANKQFTQKLADLQSDYDNWKDKTVADFKAMVDPIEQQITQNNTKLDQANAKLDDFSKELQKAETEFNSVDFTKFAKLTDLANYYTKADTYNRTEIDQKVDNAGKVKTVDNIQPDSNGNVQTDHYTKSEATQKLATKLTFVKCDSPQAAYDASKKLADDGSIQIGIYDMNDGATSAVIGDKTVTIETLYNALNSLSTTTNSSLTDLQSQINSKTSGTIITAYDIASKNPTKETNSYTNKWLVDQNVLSQFADQINQLKGRRTVDAPDFNTLTDTGVYFISSPWNGKNAPISCQGTLAVFNGNDTRTTQLYVADNGTDAYVRIYGWINSANEWGNWNQIAWKSDFTNLQNQIQAQQTAIETGYMKKPTVISKADYDKLATKDPNTLYEITE